MSTFKLTDDVRCVLMDSSIWIYENGRFWPEYQAWLAEGNIPEPYQTDAEKTSAMVNLFASERYDREVAGIVVNGMPIFTDRVSQMKILAGYSRAEKNADFTMNFKQSNGEFITLNADQTIVVGDTLWNYIQACFDRECDLQKAYADGSYTDAMLTEGWPSSGR